MKIRIKINKRKNKKTNTKKLLEFSLVAFWYL